MNIKKADTIIMQTSDTVNNWYTFAEITNVEESLKEKIKKWHLIL